MGAGRHVAHVACWRCHDFGRGGEFRYRHDHFDGDLVPAVSRLGCLDGGPLESIVRRVIVLGGRGFFGRAAAEQLRTLGVHLQTAVAQRRS